MFGGRAVSGALVTYTLVGLNVLLYLVEWVYPRIVGYLDLVGRAHDPSLHNQLVGVAAGQEYRLITSAFLHEPGFAGFGPAHIIFNMWALLRGRPGAGTAARAPPLPGRVPAQRAGRRGLLLLSWSPEPARLWAPPGAVFGLFGAWFVVSRRLQVDSRAIVILIVINLAFGFVVSGIAWQDHVGGLITGGLLTAAYAYAPRQHRALVQAGATVAVVAAAGRRRHDQERPARGVRAGLSPAAERAPGRRAVPAQRRARRYRHLVREPEARDDEARTRSRDSRAPARAAAGSWLVM